MLWWLGLLIVNWKEPRHVYRYPERPDAGCAASAGAPDGPDLQRRAVTRVGVAGTRGRDDGLLPLGGLLEEPDGIRLGAEVPRVRPEGGKISVEGHPPKDTGTEGAVGQEDARKGPPSYR